MAPPKGVKNLNSSFQQKEIEAPSSTSELFRNGKSNNSKVMGLPGGVFVQFNKSLTDPEISQIIAAENMKVKKKYSRDYFLIDSPMGLSSLKIANELNTKKGINKAYPNWWRNLSLR